MSTVEIKKEFTLIKIFETSDTLQNKNYKHCQSKAYQLTKNKNKRIE